MTVPELNVETQGLSRLSASKFAEKWKDIKEEEQYDQSFWSDFFRNILGIEDLQSAGIQFQKKVLSSKKGTWTKMDVFWKDTFIVEHKSAGKDLDAAVVQARDYLVSLPPALRPPVIIVCDFARMRIVDVLLNTEHEFRLEDLPDNLHRIEAVVNHKTKVATQVQVEADQKAAQLMADLYVQLEKYGYEGHEASVFMVRILFCLFADDTRMWKTNIFYDLVHDTNPSGVDVGPRLSNLFTILDTAKEHRRGPQDPFMVDFPYVNGGIFSERLEAINFNSDMRKALINACNYDWSSINPTIFGALFQNIKSKDERRANGEHYTTEENIDKTIRPLFIDELHEKLESAWDNDSKLRSLQRELGTYQILDPACGCGNFLITTYKRLRQLELDIIVRLKQLDGSTGLTSLFDVTEDLHVKLEQLHGIEYVEWSAQIAKVAIYLTDHQENVKLETVLGVAPNRFPLSHSANIIQGNSLLINWAEVCPMSEKTIIVGNPPFKGSKFLSDEQREDQDRIWKGMKGSGTMDYVTNWFLLGSRFVHEFNARLALVATNSITQGDQPAMLWQSIGQSNVAIAFAHKSFMWENESAGKAGVHCVIIGLRQKSSKLQLKLWEYPDPRGRGILTLPNEISGYLTDGANFLVKSQRTALAEHMPKMISGNKPRDGGFLSSIDVIEAEHIRKTDELAAKFLRPLIGAEELIRGRNSRFCLWLLDATPQDIRNSNVLRDKVNQVYEERSKATSSKGAAANRPSLFEAITQPRGRFIAVPSVTSEKRKYVPMDILEPHEIINNRVFAVLSDDLAVFALLQSRCFTLWVEAVASRLEMRFVIAASTVYNTFPFPVLREENLETLREAGKELLDAHKSFPDSTLADLYDPIAMPQSVRLAHKAIDKATLAALGISSSAQESEVLKQLFHLHRKMIDGKSKA